MQDDVGAGPSDTQALSPAIENVAATGRERAWLLRFGFAAIFIAAILVAVPYLVVKLTNAHNSFSSSQSVEIAERGRHKVRLDFIVLHPTILRVNDSVLLTIVLALNKSDFENLAKQDPRIQELEAKKAAIEFEMMKANRVFRSSGGVPGRERAFQELRNALYSHAETEMMVQSLGTQERQDIEGLRHDVLRATSNVAIVKQDIDFTALPTNVANPAVVEAGDAKTLGAVSLPPGYSSLRFWQWLMSSDKPGTRAIVENWVLNGKRSTLIQEVAFTEPWIGPENIPTALGIISGLVGLAAALVAVQKPRR